ncbi:MAG: hypothetical protein HQL24_05420 [Candidatus Omnitrophica bacterium]|nr:hypothetical protein [Candidatus Omnitrophota bacterium]
MKNILVILRTDYTAKHEIPLLLYLRDQHGFNPIVYSLSLGKNIKPLLDKHNIENYYYDQSINIRNPWMRKLISSGGISGRFLSRIKERKEAKKILEQFNPLVIITPAGTQALSRAIIRQANAKGIPSITLQRVHAGPMDLWYKWLKRQQRLADNKILSKRESFAVFLTHIRENIISFLEKIVDKLFNLSYKQSVCLGDGEESKFAVIGEGFKDLFIQEGIEEDNKIVVVGHLEHDMFYPQGQLVKEPLRTQMRNQLGISPTQKMVLFNVPPGHLQRINLYDYNTLILKTLAQVLEAEGNKFRIILKYHPRPGKEKEFDPVLLENPLFRVDKENDTLDLLHAADYYVSYESTVNLCAIALDVPMLTFNLARVGQQDLNENIMGGPHVRYDWELKEMLNAFFYDEVMEKFYAQQRARARLRWMKCDGKVKERIAQLIESFAKSWKG